MTTETRLPSTFDPTPTADTEEAAASGPARGSLRLTSVLLSGLPVTLGTSAEPSRYTVPVVLSRQVTPAERQHIEAPTTARAFQHAEQQVELAISDRRLLVKNTTLAELRDGLAAELADLVRQMGVRDGAEEARRAAEADERRTAETARAAAVAAAVAEIRFE